MPGVSRTLSTRSTRLTARASPYNSEVTLFESNAAGPASPRRSKRVKREVEVDDPMDSLAGKSKTAKAKSSPSKTSTSKKAAAKSPQKPKPIPQALAVPHPTPERWQETYNIIREMRSRIAAPVDTMGCDKAHLKEPSTDPKTRRFATLISLMLSSQTKDEVTDAAVSKLRTALGGSLTVDALADADDKTISEAICKVGFWPKKTKYIKLAAQRLRSDFDSDVPKTVDELCSLQGVGPKMAFLTLHNAWNINVGIGVDVHVHRITNRLGWHKPCTKTPEETRLNLQSWLPAEFHREINHMLVGFGQSICLPVGPRCDLCDVSAAGLCPSAQKVSKSKVRKGVVVAPKSPTSGSPPKIEIELEDEEKPALYTIPDSSAGVKEEIKTELTW
ncbi:putative bifunctional DNA N-glycosylase with associated apurinic apyrimidinic (AP) lyase function that catalyzes the first step in base excision repair (BER), the primary repair pathway for the repair of oxidative DNA damage [Lyophyllum shimeji]|uniref:Endonuclease III homolog n=1 Tax=Lyophyllum shimeji TaxID=47721 RepID=A0A9P3ULN8_LYOSH|nr:putative bifunctional DNA N-glycosylase with associated apurinic apyrimidinic (AP) lyase function that catalyzes the first step in base excision repair (BER), the primary repair pathway for the repair of oxidative DNA damage [Lyophyllum shimeji]